MNKKLLVTLMLAATGWASLSAKGEPDWKECGENWGNALAAPKSGALYTYIAGGIKKIANKKIPDNLRLYGKVQLKSVRVAKNLTCYGSADLSGVTVSGVTTMYGPMTAQKSTFNNLDVRCSQEAQEGLTLSDAKVNKLLVYGTLKADRSTLEKVTAFSQELELTNSHVSSIVMMNGQKNTKKAVIVLEDTMVDGPIYFSQKGGLVICKGTSQVTGKIIGGTLIKK